MIVKSIRVRSRTPGWTRAKWCKKISVGCETIFGRNHLHGAAQIRPGLNLALAASASTPGCERR
jgi:hypothetical protein